MKFLTRLLPFLLMALLAIPLSHAETQFSDVDDEHFYEPGISYLNDAGIVEGYDDGEFKPETSINRAEFLKIVLLAGGHEAGGSDCYSDVTDQWFAGYICAASDLGFVDGYSDGTFRPEQYVNFAEASKIISNIMGLSVDEQATDPWYERYVVSLGDAGAIAPTIVSFSQEVNRGEMAAMVSETMDYPYAIGLSRTYDSIVELESEEFEYLIVYKLGISSYLDYLYSVSGELEFLNNYSSSVSPDGDYFASLQYLEVGESSSAQLILETLPNREVIMTVEATLDLLYERGSSDYDESSSIAWSHDGTHLSFSMMNQSADPVTHAFIIDLENQTYETFGLDEAYYICGAGCYPEVPQWSPNDEQLLILGRYFDYEDGSDTYGEEFYYFQIWDTSGNLEDSIELDHDDPYDYTYSYGWTDDGSQIEATNYEGDVIYFNVNPFTSDFDAPEGEAEEHDGDETPGARRILSAYSDDGIVWTKTNEIVTDQADVPELVIDDEGVLYMYYYGWEVGDYTNEPAVAISYDDGETWVFKYMDFDGFSGKGTTADPDLLYEDGLFRMYGTVLDEGHLKLVYGESMDGIHFNYIEDAFSVDDYPAGVANTYRSDDVWHMLSLASLGEEGLESGTHWYATSTDGNAFDLIETLSFDVDGDNYVSGNVVPIDDGFRFYAFTPMGTPIRSFWSDDGVNWELEEYEHITLAEDNGLEDHYVGEPDVIQLPDGRYFMVYVTLIP
jgi:hypothetical protein